MVILDIFLCAFEVVHVTVGEVANACIVARDFLSEVLCGFKALF